MRKKQSVLTQSSSERMLKVYFVLFAVCAVLTVIGMLLSDGRSFTDTLYYGLFDNDEFMDFYNSIRDAGTREVYKKGVIYPPLANVFFFFISKMTNPAMVALPNKERAQIRSDAASQALLFIYLFACVLLIARLIQQKTESRFSSNRAWLFSLMMIASYPVIYCIQRGNLLLLTMALSMFFVFFRNDKRKWVRELALLSLAAAAGFKLYPAVLGLLLIKDKKYKQAVRLILYGILFVFVPFFFYDGFESIKDLIVNIQNFDSKKQITPGFVTVDVFAEYGEYFLGLNFDIIHWLLFPTTMLAAVAVFFLAKEEWKQVWCLIYLFMNINSCGQTYILVFALIPFVLFLTERNGRKIDLLYLLLFAVLLLAVPPLYYSILNPSGAKLIGFGKYLIRPNQITSAFAVQGLLAVLALDTLFEVAKKSKKRNAENTADNKRTAKAV
ncbi:MAG TPA: hypothetical protein DDY98_02675 [Ruminococcaceae bacterium]|nr:hypothetical protein [Oscillospiraceae bacterium]